MRSGYLAQHLAATLTLASQKAFARSAPTACLVTWLPPAGRQARVPAPYGCADSADESLEENVALVSMRTRLPPGPIDPIQADEKTGR
jgi:hypothetical protein